MNPMTLGFFSPLQWALIIGLAIIVVVLVIIKKKQQQ